MIKCAEDYSKAHMYDAQYHRHLHLIGVEECEAVGSQVPNLYNRRKTNYLNPKCYPSPKNNNQLCLQKSLLKEVKIFFPILLSNS